MAKVNMGGLKSSVGSFFNSSAGKKVIDGIADKESMAAAGNEFANRIRNNLSANNLSSVGVSVGPVVGSDGEYSVTVSLDNVERPSFGTSGPAYDIVSLFIRGWDTDPSKKRAVGTWHGIKGVLNKRSRQASPGIITDAADGFTAPGLKEIIINPWYK